MILEELHRSQCRMVLQSDSDLVELVEAVVVHEKVDDERVDERLQS